MELVRLHIPELGARYAVRREDRFDLVSSPFGEMTSRRIDALKSVETIPRDTDVERLAPATPSKIVCVGRNFRSHADELDNPVPDEPLIFLKPPSALIGSDCPIAYPAASEEVHHEAELALVIGERLVDASADNAGDAIWGYTCGNDVTARDLQTRDKTFTRGKGFDTFCPLGPHVVPADTFEPARHHIRAQVNGTRRQSAALDSMLVSIPELLAFISGVMTLQPGDVVLTGTPDGVGPIEPGDRVSIEVDGVGTLTNEVVARESSRSS